MKNRTVATAQAGFGFEEEFEKNRLAYLPATFDDALPVFWQLLRDHHAAMMAGKVDETLRLRKMADDIACHLNDDDMCGINGGEGSPCDLLERATTAEPGQVPLWGQIGTFRIEMGVMKIDVEFDGIYAIGADFSYWLPFSIHAVEWDKPFPSETGYRWYHVGHSDAMAIGPAEYARSVIHAELSKMKKVPYIKADYQNKHLTEQVEDDQENT